jgi:hypothetical protein
MKKLFILITALLLTHQEGFSQARKMRVRLGVVNTGGVSNVDHAYAVFDNSYSNSIDANDTPKYLKVGENVCIERFGNKYATETREDFKTGFNDTTFLLLLDLGENDYRLRFEPKDFYTKNLSADLYDNYLMSSTAINTSSATNVFFSVDSNAASGAANRFYIVYNRTQVDVDTPKYSWGNPDGDEDDDDDDDKGRGTGTGSGTSSCSITLTPANTTYTGGIPNNIYLGYGPQSATIAVTAPTSGNNFSYSWSSSTYLSCGNCSSPVFTPTVEGNYTYTVTISDNSGPRSSCSVSFCVRDIRVPNDENNSGTQVYVCEIPTESSAIDINDVAAYLQSPGTRLGKCSQSCGVNKNSGKNEPATIAAAISEMKVYPNPSAGAITIELPEAFRSGTVIITDIAGRMIERKQAAGSQIMQFDLSENAAGIYFIELTSGKETQRKKIALH